MDVRWVPLRVTAKAVYALVRFFVRLWDLMKVGRYDIYCFEHQAFPYLPAFLEKIARRINPNMLLEFDDAIFLTSLHKRKIPKLIAMSRYVIVGNDYLGDYALKFNPHVTIIPTVLDTERYHKKQDYRPQGKVNIGWVGLAYNLPYLQRLEGTFQKLKAEVGDFIFTLICSKGIKMDGVKIDFKPWNYDDEAKDIGTFDIGIMPLPNDD